MTHALVRRSSSKQGLQTLMRLTAQRSIEDAEEVERERRRRAREELRRRDSGSVQGESPESDTPPEDSHLDGSYKPSSSPSLEEDEGFSDWTQRRQKQRQQRQQELNHHQQQQHNGAEEEEEEEYDPNTGQATTQGSSRPSLAASRLQKQELERQEMERRKQRQEEAVRAERARRERGREGEVRGERGREELVRSEREEPVRSERGREGEVRREELVRCERGREEGAARARREEEERKWREEATKREEERHRSHRPNAEVQAEKGKDVKVSYTSRVVLSQEPKHVGANGDASPPEKAPLVSTGTRGTRRSISRASEPEESEAILETERRLEKIRRGLQEKESQEMGQLRQRQAEAEQELEELKRKREERRRFREEEERRRGQEEQSRLAKEEEEKRRMKEEIERRRMEAAERMKSLSTSCEGDETFSPFSPKTPTHKITERTESLNRSLKKSNSFKRTPPLVVTSTIDDKLEQYTHAIENSSETRPVKAAPANLPSAPEVATKKTLFEAGEVFGQSPTKAPGCKDTEGLKVGVASLITQWVKGPNDTGRQVPGKATDVKPGDVMQKRNMWEGMGETSFRTGQRSRGSLSGKKYKYVVTGHGKYEKIPMDDDGEGEFGSDL